jgi:Rrf2 family nitric oxide-sensitive transcriptional repressor
MELTQHTDYGLRVLMYAAVHDDRRVTMREIATAYGISMEHLRKVVHRLSRRGFLLTSKGRSGGLELADRADAICIGDVVRSLEDSLSIMDCERQPCVLAGACALKCALESARQAFMAELNTYTLADIIGDRTTAARLATLAPVPDEPFPRQPR